MAVSALVLVAGVAPARADEGEPFDGKTVGIQAVAGTLGVIVGGSIGVIGGGLLGYSTARNNSANSNGGTGSEWGPPLVGAAIGGVIVGEIGLAYGVQHWGDKHRGTGTLPATVVGGLLGFGGALGVGYLAIKAKLPLPVVGVLAGSVLIASPIVAYHLSADDVAASTARMVPLIATSF